MITAAHHDPSAEPIRPDDPRIGPDWTRRYRRGQLFSWLWLLAGFAVMIGGVLTKAGPFGWLASLQLRLFGSDNPILSALPALALMMAPTVAATLSPKTIARPFLFGIQDSIDPSRRPVLQRPPVDAVRRLRILWRGALIVAFPCLASVGIGIWKMEHAPSGPLIALPHLAYASAVSGAPLPKAARIDGVGAFAQVAWAHNYRIRQTRYRDVYYPLAPAGWAPGDPIALIELDRILPDDDPAPYNQVNAPGPREGLLTPLDDAWIAGELRRSGWTLAAHPIVLERKQLGGFEPRPDEVDAFVDYTLWQSAIAFTALLMAWSARRRLRLLAPAPPKRR